LVLARFPSADDAFGASVTIPLDPSSSDWRIFGVTPVHTTRELACEAAASSALDAGILELIESRVRPKARPAPPIGLSTEDNKSRGDSKSVDKPGIALATQVPKHGEELAAARRAMYGGFGAATQYQLREIERKLEAELEAEKERDEARREEERKADELKRMGNPLLPDVFATAKTLLSLEKANSTPTTTTTSTATTTTQQTSHVAALRGAVVFFQPPREKRFLADYRIDTLSLLRATPPRLPAVPHRPALSGTVLLLLLVGVAGGRANHPSLADLAHPPRSQV
jgi:hypothetical protein